MSKWKVSCQQTNGTPVSPNLDQLFQLEVSKLRIKSSTEIESIFKIKFEINLILSFAGFFPDNF